MRLAIGFAALMLITPLLKGEPKDIAELFPRDTLLYVEVNQPGVVGKDLTAYLKGSVFETSAPKLPQTPPHGPGGGINTSEGGLLAAILCPEMLKEAVKFKGMAAGFIGIDKQATPEFLVAVLPGDSKLPENLMRCYLTARVDFRKVTTVEGVDLFQRHQIQLVDDPLLLLGGANPAPRQALPGGMALAYAPGLVVVGSSKEVVSTAIRRFKGKEKSESLTASGSFPLLVEERTKPGILLLANARQLLEQIDRNGKYNRELDWLAFKNLLPSASANALVCRLECKDDAIRLRARLRLDEKNVSPLAQLLESAVLTPTDLDGIATDSPMVLALALPPGEKRVPRLLAALDAIVKATGTLGPNASELLQELEQSKYLSSALLAKVNRITIALPPVAAWPKNKTPLPTLMLHSDDADALAKIEAALPALFELLTGKRADPVTETINGVKVRSLEAAASPTGSPIHYGRHGTALALAAERNRVAEILNKPSSKKLEIDSALKALNKPALVCVWNWAEMLQPRPPEKPEKQSLRKIAFMQPEWQIEEVTRRLEAMRRSRPNNRMPTLPEIFSELKSMPPLIASLSRQGNELHLEIVQIDPKRIRIKGLNQVFEWFVQNADYGRGYSNTIIDGSIDILPLQPAPPFPLPPLP